MAKSTIGLYLVAFVVLFAWALVNDPLATGFFAALGEPWVWVVWMDFVFGCLLLSWMIYFIEGSAKVALMWAIPLFIVGNIVGAIYVLLYLEKIKSRLSASN